MVLATSQPLDMRKLRSNGSTSTPRFTSLHVPEQAEAVVDEFVRAQLAVQPGTRDDHQADQARLQGAFHVGESLGALLNKTKNVCIISDKSNEPERAKRGKEASINQTNIPTNT